MKRKVVIAIFLAIIIFVVGRSCCQPIKISMPSMCDRLNFWFPSGQESFIVTDQDTIVKFTELINSSEFRPTLIKYREMPAKLYVLVQFVQNDTSLGDVWLIRNGYDEMIYVNYNQKQVKLHNPDIVIDYISSLIEDEGTLPASSGYD